MQARPEYFCMHVCMQGFYGAYNYRGLEHQVTNIILPVSVRVVHVVTAICIVFGIRIIDCWI